MTIPVISLGDARRPGGASVQAVAMQLREACMESGFFYLVDHGVPEALIAEQFRLTRAFFDLPAEQKEAISLHQSPAMRGYEGIGEQTLDAAARPDQKESFYCGLEFPDDHPYVRKGYQSYGRNQWPAQIPEMASHSAIYIAAMQDLSVRLMQLLAVSLELPEGYFDNTHDNPMITLRLLRYPPHPADADETTFGAGAHTDWGAVTLLAQDHHGGLEVRMPNGEWVEAIPMVGSLVVNLGDMIPRWTNDRYRSNAHRVRNLRSGDQPRHSIPFFYNPDYEAPVTAVPTCIEPGATAKYPPCSAGEHLREMYVKTYGMKPVNVVA